MSEFIYAANNIVSFRCMHL